MHTIKPANTPSQACANCPNRANNSDLGQQIMLVINEMTPLERQQMESLINDLITASRQRH